MKNFKSISKDLANQIEKDLQSKSLSPFATSDENAVRRKDNPHDYATVIRSPFIRDVDKILHCPFYSRYSDKTQVFSFNVNDDIARRSIHVQIVSRIARTIGRALNLNLDLIEAIALGHDLGHTPFGHTGEHVLSALSKEKTGKIFAHNLHSLRVVDEIIPLNLTLFTLDGIVCHNGEAEMGVYSPREGLTFSRLDSEVKECYYDENKIKNLTPSTLEGCVVRISDIIAYLGKDRIDAEKSKVALTPFADYGIGVTNSEIINNLTVNLIENSYNKPYLKFDDQVFEGLQKAKKDNYDNIYNNPLTKENDGVIKEMMYSVYEVLYEHLNDGVKSSPLFSHHIEYLEKPYYKRPSPYMENDKHQIIIDYIASMTDDYLIAIYRHLFPNGNLDVKYRGYFK